MNRSHLKCRNVDLVLLFILSTNIEKKIIHLCSVTIKRAKRIFCTYIVYENIHAYVRYVRIKYSNQMVQIFGNGHSMIHNVHSTISSVVLRENHVGTSYMIKIPINHRFNYVAFSEYVVYRFTYYITNLVEPYMLSFT